MSPSGPDSYVRCIVGQDSCTSPFSIDPIQVDLKSYGRMTVPAAGNSSTDIISIVDIMRPYRVPCI